MVTELRNWKKALQTEAMIHQVRHHPEALHQDLAAHRDPEIKCQEQRISRNLRKKVNPKAKARQNLRTRVNLGMKARQNPRTRVNLGMKARQNLRIRVSQRYLSRRRNLHPEKRMIPSRIMAGQRTVKKRPKNFARNWP